MMIDRGDTYRNWLAVLTVAALLAYSESFEQQ